MNSTSRVAKTREKAAQQGRKRKEYSVTEAEHKALRKLLKEIRNRP